MTKASEYGISVRLVVRDGAELYEARVSELQDVLAFGDTYAEAYDSAIEAITGIQEMFAEQGKSLPPPIQENFDFSGRVTLRMSKSLHQCVHAMAARDGVSLNQWIVEAIGCRISPVIATTNATTNAAASISATMSSAHRQIFVASPMRRNDPGAVAWPMQPAIQILTGQMQSGSTVSYINKTGNTEYLSTPSHAENIFRWVS